MSINKNLVAIGRSGLLYASIRHLHAKGFGVKAIVTDEGNAEYEVGLDDFRSLAEEIGAELVVGKSVDGDVVKSVIDNYQIKVAISVNWKYTIGPEVLNMFPLGILNYHLGNLPDYKGNATVNWTILQGETYINGNVHKMAEQLDAGDIISRKAIAIDEHTYVGDVLAQANVDAPLLFEEALAKLVENEHYVLEKGTADGLRCYPRLPEDGLINWKDSGVHIHRLVRASSKPFQGAFTYYRGAKAMIWKASLLPAANQWLAVPGHIIQIDKNAGTITVATGDGLLMIEEMEWEGVSGKPTQWCKSIRERFSNRHHAHE